MRVAALYDIHGNIDALEAVLAEVETAGIDVILLGGDIAAGAYPAETMRRLRSLGERARWIRGNADRELGEALEERAGGAQPDVAAWVREQLSGDELSFLSTLPERTVLEVDGLGAVLFCHATPRNDHELVTPASPDRRLAEVLGGVAEPVVVCGHTHTQFERWSGTTLLVNAGSVGMPYEDAPGAYWALLGPGVEFRRTALDDVAVAARIRQSGFPDEWPSASRAEATEYFERLARG